MRILLTTLSLILTVSLSFSSIATASGVIEDPNLEKVIREKLNLSDKSILAADVNKMDKLLEYKPRGIKSLKGLEHATGLNELLLIGNEIKDLEPLSGMQRIMSFYMNHNRIANLEPLKNMTRLINVDLDYNQVYDITPLNKATQLSVLRLESNPVEDISILKDMKKLKGLNIANTSVMDISPLAGLPLLEFLFLNDTEISDLTPLRELPSLHSLYLNNNPLTEESLQVIEELKERNVRILDPNKSFNQITEKHIRVTLDGEELLFEQSPVLLNQTTVVPMRGIYSALGAKVEWNEAERKVTASLGSKVVKLKIGSRTALVDEKRQLLDEKVMLVNATTMVPVRFISESLGAKVDWLSETNTVAITTVP